MSLSKMSAGDGFRYLFDQTISADIPRNPGQSLEEYYTRSGCPDGVWVGRGIDALDVAGTVTETQMAALYGEGIHPNADHIIAQIIADKGDPDEALQAAKLGRPFYELDAENGRLAGAYRYELKHARTVLGRALTRDERHNAAQLATRRFLADRSHNSADDTRRGGRQAVSGFDLTFSVPKSFSVVWATSDTATQHMIEAWHEAAIAEALDYIQDRAVFTRRGPDGIATLDTHGLVAARFRHWDSRDGDPQLHDHVAVANRVLGSDGKWRTIDGAVLYKWKVAASEAYNRSLMDQVHAAGYATRLRDPGSHKQPTVELAGVSDAHIEAFSTRRGAIKARTAQLEQHYQQVHGHAPSKEARYALAQQATLETRAPKDGPHTLEQLRQQWRQRIDQPVQLITQTPDTTMHLDVDAVARETITHVSAERATWSRNHVEAQVNRWAAQQPYRVTADHRNAIIDAALTTHSVTITPASTAPQTHDQATRKDGVSIYLKPHHHRYTSGAVMAAEDRLLAAADELALSAIEPRHMAEAIAAAPEWVDADGLAFAEKIATNDRILTIGLGPAGTGKTTAATVVSDAAHRAGVHVHALATAARTATDLGQAIHADHTMTLAAWTHGGADTVSLSAGDIIIIDEAGMASTFDIDHVVTCAKNAGAHVIALGDDRQLGPIGAGGAMALVASSVGSGTTHDRSPLHRPRRS